MSYYKSKAFSQQLALEYVTDMFDKGLADSVTFNANHPLMKSRDKTFMETTFALIARRSQHYLDIIEELEKRIQEIQEIPYTKQQLRHMLRRAKRIETALRSGNVPAHAMPQPVRRVHWPNARWNVTPLTPTQRWQLENATKKK